MNIAMYCATAHGSRKVIADCAEELGGQLAGRGHTLVYGGTSIGLMGIVADAALAAGGQVVGVLPAAERIRSVRHQGLTCYIETQSISERKMVMSDMADAYIALPGGPGTLDEMAEVIALSKIGLQRKPCVLLDIDGFYQPLKEMYETMLQAGFVTAEELSCVLFCADMDTAWKFIETGLRTA